MSNTDYLKAPVEMAKFALSQRKAPQVGTYLASHFLYSGKAPTDARPDKRIAHFINISHRQTRRHFSWLLARNWFGKDEKNGWYFFRGIDQVRKQEGWTFKRSTILYPGDLKTLKAFLAGAVIASLVKSGNSGGRTERQRGGSEQAARPISISAFSNTLEVSESTAKRLLKLAQEHNYINSRQNLVQVTGLTPQDLGQLKRQDLDKISVVLFGYPGKRTVSVERLRYSDGHVFLQEPNNIESLMRLKSR